MQCPRCGSKETWSHVVQCRTLSDYNDPFVKDVEKNIKKIARMDQQQKVIRNVISDMRNFLLNGSNNYNTN